MTSIKPFWTVVKAEERTQAQVAGADGQNEYLMTLLNPNIIADIADNSTTPYTRKQMRMTLNLKGSDEYVFVESMSSRRVGKLLTGKRVTHPGTGRSQIGWAAVYGLDEDPSANYAKGRVVSGMLEIFTSTVPSGAFALDGRMTGTVLYGPIDWNNMDPGNLTSYNTELAVQNIAVQTGVVYRGFPEGEANPFAPYSRVSFGQTLGAQNNTSGGTGGVVCRSWQGLDLSTFPYASPTQGYYFNSSRTGDSALDGLSLIGLTHIEATIDPTSAIAYPYVIALQASYLNASGVLTMLKTQAANVTMAESTVHLSMWVNSDLPISDVQVFNEDQLAASARWITLTITNYSQQDQTSGSPTFVCRVAGFPTDASLTLSAVENHEVQPNTSMSKEITAIRNRRGHIHDQQLAMAYLRSSPDAKPIMTRDQFRSYMNSGDLDTHTSRRYLTEVYALSLGDIWRGIKRAAPAVMRALPGALSHMGYAPAAQFVSAVNPLIGVNAKEIKHAYATMCKLVSLDMKLDQAEAKYGAEYVRTFNGKVYLLVSPKGAVPGDSMMEIPDAKLWTSDEEKKAERTTASAAPEVAPPQAQQASVHRNASTTENAAPAPRSSPLKIVRAMEEPEWQDLAVDQPRPLPSLPHISTAPLPPLPPLPLPPLPPIPVVMSDVKEAALTTLLPAREYKEAPVLEDNIVEDAIDVQNLVTMLTKEYLSSYPDRAKAFMATGNAPNSRSRLVPFPYIKEDGSANLAVMALTTKPIRTPVGSFRYVKTPARDGEMYVSTNIYNEPQLQQLCQKLGASETYLTCADPFNVEQIDVVHERSHFLATYALLRGIPVDCVLSGIVDPDTLAVSPVGGVKEKAKAVLLQGWRAAIVMTDQDAKAVGAPSVSAVASGTAAKAVLRVEHIAEVLLLPTVTCWVNDLTKAKTIGLIESQAKLFSKKQYEDLMKAAVKPLPSGPVYEAVSQKIRRAMPSQTPAQSSWVPFSQVKDRLAQLKLTGPPMADQARFKFEYAKLHNLLLQGIKASPVDPAAKKEISEAVEGDVWHLLTEPRAEELIFPPTTQTLADQILNRVLAPGSKKKKKRVKINKLVKELKGNEEASAMFSQFAV